MEQNLEDQEFRFLEPSENAGRCIQIERKAQRMLTHYAARWRIESELFEKWHL